MVGNEIRLDYEAKYIKAMQLIYYRTAEELRELAKIYGQMAKECEKLFRKTRCMRYATMELPPALFSMEYKRIVFELENALEKAEIFKRLHKKIFSLKNVIDSEIKNIKKEVEKI